MRTLAIAKKVLRELIRDKRSLVLMFLGPILIMWLLNVMFSANSKSNITVNVATINISQELDHKLNQIKGIHTKKYHQEKTAQKKLQSNKIDAVIKLQHNKYNVTYANTDYTKTTLTKQALNTALTQQTIAKLVQGLKYSQLALRKSNPNFTVLPAEPLPKIKVVNHYQYGDSQTGFFTKIVPILMAFFVFFFVFLISGMALLKERTSGTLDRLLATPVRRSEIVYGYMISYGIISILQSTVIVLSTIWLLKIEVVGHVFDIIAISFLLALVALAFGILLSTLAGSEFQMMQFLPLVIVPQVFFSGIIPLDSMATWVQYIGKILPLTYSGDALSKIIIYGQNLTQLGGDIFALMIFLIILLILNIIGLKRYRKV